MIALSLDHQNHLKWPKWCHFRYNYPCHGVILRFVGFPKSLGCWNLKTVSQAVGFLLGATLFGGHESVGFLLRINVVRWSRAFVSAQVISAFSQGALLVRQDFSFLYLGLHWESFNGSNTSVGYLCQCVIFSLWVRKLVLRKVIIVLLHARTYNLSLSGFLWDLRIISLICHKQIECFRLQNSAPWCGWNPDFAH